MFQCQVKWDSVFVPCLSKRVHWWWHFHSYGIRQGLDSHPTFTWPAELKQISTRKSVTCSPSFHLTPFKNCHPCPPAEPRGWRATGFWVPRSSAAVNRSFRSSGVEPVTKGQGGAGVGDLRAWQRLPLAFSWGTLAPNHSRSCSLVCCAFGVHSRLIPCLHVWTSGSTQWVLMFQDLRLFCCCLGELSSEQRFHPTQVPHVFFLAVSLSMRGPHSWPVAWRVSFEDLMLRLGFHTHFNQRKNFNFRSCGS